MAPSLWLLRARGRLSVGRGVSIGRRARIDVSAGARVVLEDGVMVGERLTVRALAGEVRIGAGSRLGDEVRILADASVTVGPRCLLADGATLLTALPAHSDPSAPGARPPVRIAPVAVEAGAQLHDHAVVEPGVTVGAGAQVGTRAVAGADVPPGGRVEGVHPQTVAAPLS